MKRFFLNLVYICVLIRLFCCCSIGGIPGSAENEEIIERYEKYEAETNVSDPESLLFLVGKMVSETEINFEFSQPVKVVSLVFDPILTVGSMEEGATITVHLEEYLEPGTSFVAELLVENEWGNSISVLVPLRSRNNRVPELLINELRTVYSSSQSRVEFIEFRIKTAGNLGALRVFAASNNRNPMIYQFLPVEVKAGERVVLHLRTLHDSSRDEYGENLAESSGTDSSPTARDFWISGSNRLLRNTDGVYVLDQDDRVLDAVMISETQDLWWSNNYIAEAADFLFRQGAWKSSTGGICSPADAVDTSEIRTAATRSISRDETAEDTNTAANWFVTATGGATPGLPNIPKI